MKKLLTSLALLGAVLPIFSINTVSWEIKQNPVDGTSGFPQTATGRQIFVDYNNDGILDFFIIAGQGNAKVGLYRGNANGSYSDVSANSPEIYAKSKGSAIFIDINNDGNLDLVTMGKDGESILTDVYMNSGAPDYKFALDLNLINAFPGLSIESNDNGSKVLVGFDYNNDGWTDLLINGNAGGVWEAPDGNGQQRVVAILKNNKGKFEVVRNVLDGNKNFVAMNGGSIDVADFNRDGWMDIITTGYEDNEKNITKLYKNNGNGTFSEVTGINFVGHQQGETAFIDINNDGYPDIVEIGRDVKNGWSNFGKLYINDKTGGFTRFEEATTNLFGGGCALSIGDINNDGLTDFFMTGWNTNATIMYNNGDNSFTKESLVPDAARCRGGANVFADVDRNGFLDMSLFGYRDGGGDIPSGDGLGTWPDYILINKGGNGVVANTAPTAPSNVTAVYNSVKKCYEIKWNKSTDDTTPADALRYNIYIKTSDGKINLLAPADIATGNLKVVGTQYPFIVKNEYELYIAENATTEIGVQAIDNSWAASAFTKAGAESNINNLLDNSNYEVFVSEQGINIQNRSNKTGSIRILTMDGRTVKATTCNMGETLSYDLNKGFYLVEVIIDGQKATTKVTVF